MSNNAHVNDDELEIHQLPEVSTLQAGMMVAVDSQPTGTKSFNLTTALEGKANAATNTPVAGQVLTFDGTNNTWENPPEGIYVLNYSDVTSYNDIDAERAGSQPTFIKIDSSVPLTVQGISGSTTINMENQIMQLTDYNVNNAWHVFRGYNMGSFPGNFPTADRVGSSYHFEVVLQIFRPEITQNTKLWSVFGDYMDGRNVFNTEPQPYTVSYNNGKGGDLSGKTGRSTAVQFTASNGEYRKNLLMPYEIQDHLFYSDASPEVLQFMAWGSTSNRAGYRTCLIATQNNANYPAQTPTVSFNKYIMGSTEQSDNVGVSLNVEMISSTAGQASSFYGGNLVPTLGTVGALQYWSDNNGAHYGFKPVNEVPASTSSNASQVLTVAANGTPGWGNAVGFVKNAGALTDAATITASNLNNGFATLSTSQSALTIIDVVGTDEIVNFAIEITPSVNCTLTIQKQIGSGTPVTLKHAVSAGNELEAGKTYQVTAVGTCWTLAEFES